MNVTNRLLIVDDQSEYAQFVTRVAESAGFEVVSTDRVDDFLVEYDRFGPTVLSIDLMMPDGGGITLLQDLASRGCKAAILIQSGLDARTLAWAETLGRESGLHLVGAIAKPVRAAVLRSTLEGLKASG